MKSIAGNDTMLRATLRLVPTQLVPPSLRTEDLEPHATTTLIAREKRSEGNWGRSWVGTRLRVALALVSFPAIDFLYYSSIKKT